MRKELGKGNKMKKLFISLTSLLFLMVLSGSASATHISCGDTITTNTTLDSDLTCSTTNGLVIGADGITLDGKWHTITGNSGATFGVQLNGRKGVTIKYTNINDFTTGIYLINSHGNTFTDNTFSNNDNGIGFTSSNGNTLTYNNVSSSTNRGIGFTSSNGNTLTYNNVSSSYRGIILETSSGNILENNITSSNNKGIFISNSNDNTLTSNATSNNGIGIILDTSSGNTLTSNESSNNVGGIILGYSDNNSLINNIILNSSDNGIGFNSSNGNTLTGNNVSSSTSGGIHLSSSSNNTLTNNASSNNKEGIYLSDSDGNTFTDNTFSNNDNGISLLNSYDNSLINNTILDSSDNGIGFNSSNDNTLTGNNVSSSTNNGIDFNSSNGNTLTGNNVSSSTNLGIYISNSDDNTLTSNATSNNGSGIWIFRSDNNTLTSNASSSNINAGIILGTSSGNNTLTGNTVSKNKYGIFLQDGTTNTNFIYNNIFNNTQNTLNIASAGSNDWNATKTSGTNIVGGPNLGGNFWAKPDGTGFSQTCTDAGSDGICDSSYTLASGNVDYLPLANGGVTANRPPVANAGEDFFLECLDLPCTAILDGSGSYDLDSTLGTADDIVSYEWYVLLECLDPTCPSSGVSVSVDLSLGDHTITLLVEDTAGNTATDTITVSVSLADLSPFGIHKAEVKWDKQKIKVHGKVGLPAGKGPFDVSPDGTVTISLSTPLDQVVNQSVIFDVKGHEGKKWEYKDDSNSGGIHKFKIDWKGAEFKYHGAVKMKTKHIGQDATTLEIDLKRNPGPLTIVIEDVTIEIDELGTVSVTSDTLEIDLDHHHKIEVELPFALIPGMTINISGTVSDTITVADYYTATVGKFKIEALFDPSGYDGDLSPATLDMEIILGEDVGYLSSFQILEGEWKKIKTDEWKYKWKHKK